jgi:hypothetical protein
MAKAGSGFRRASGAATVSATGGRGGRWTVADLQGAGEEVTRLYWNAYRRVGDVFERDSNGKITGAGPGFDKLVNQAEALANKLAGDVRHVDRDAQSMYRDMQRWASRITASEQERKEFDRTYTGEKNFAGRGGSGGDASEAARQMAGLGLIPHEIAAMGNNVDVMNAINDAMNSVKGMIYTRMSPKEQQDYVSDIFMGLMEGYKGVESGENRRRR